MSKIVQICTAVPPHRIDQASASKTVTQLFRNSGLDIDRLLPIFLNTEIENRYISAPIEWYEHNHDFATKNALFLETAIALSEKAVAQVCDQANIAPDEIDHVFMISTTGIATPSIDAHLLNRLSFKSGIRRTPIWGLGCAGGVAGLSRAHDWLKAYPSKLALVISLELCSLTFISNDRTRSNFVATALFGDGCAAALLAGDQHPHRNGRAIRIEDTAAVTWPDSLDVMGWDINDAGLKVIFSQSIPKIVQASARPVMQDFLNAHSLCMSDIDYFLSHPGGAKVIAAYINALDLNERQVADMRCILRDFGNMSSVTVLFVLEHFMRSGQYHSGARILSAALGPGFSSEMLLARSC